jgi:gliding motility-associated-like protein
MNMKIKRLNFFFLLFILSGQTLYSQSYTSKNNYTGTWQTPSSWIPTWPVPQLDFTGDIITINGYIIANNSLSLSDQSSIIINDTLVIEGDLTLNDHTVLTINDNGILIVRGNLFIGDHTFISANAYLIVSGNVTKTHSIDHGSFTSNDNPVKVFIGGTISPATLTDNNPNSPIFNCSAPPTIPYPGSSCSYGNMSDLMNDPVYSFFQSACTIATPTITAGGPTTFCEGGSVTLTSSAGITFLWSTGATTPVINVTTSGNYTVRVTNAAGCLSAASEATVVTVNTSPVTPTITADGPTAFCAGGSVSLSSSPGASYLWSTGATTPNINVTTAGSYSVRVTNANGCQSASSVAIVVTVNALPPTPVIAADGPTTFCEGGSVTLTSSAGSTYSWSTGETTPDINVTTTGSYSVKVTNANGCTSASSAATVVTVNPIPDKPTISPGGPTTFCEGGSVTLTSSPSSSYLWSTGETTQAIDVTSTGNYTVRVTSSTGCHSLSSAATPVTVNALPPTPAITASGPTTFCEGSNVTLTSSSGSTYLWSTGETTASINASISGNYSVRVTNPNGCQSASSVATIVTVNTLPATPTITAGGPTTFCDGSSVNLISTPGSTYLWSTGETTPGINVASSGSYTVITTNATGCQSTVSAATLVTVNALPATPTITDDGPTTFCAGGSVNLTSSPGSSYLWSTGATTSTIHVTASGNYSVRVTNANGCQSTSSIATIVTSNALPATPVITAGGPTTFCEGGSVNLTSSPGTSYLWSTGETSSGVDVSITGSYTVRVTNVNGCQSAPSLAALVTVNALPAMPVITSSGPTTFCEGESVTLTSSAGSSYLWSTGATTSGINVSTAGNYSVQVTDANGCQSPLSAATAVLINTLPVVDAGTDVTIPNGTSTTIDATVTGDAPFTYSWSPAGQLINSFVEDPTTVNLASTTTFTLTATSAATSCFNTNTVTISISGGPLSSSPTATPSTVCNGQTVQLNAIASGGSGSYTYTWTSIPAGFTSSIDNPTVNPAVSTTYNVAVFDGFNTVSSQVNVTVNALPVTPVITASGPTSFCEGGSVTLTSSPGTTYLWSTGETSSGINVSTTGSYTVRIINANGCLSAASIPSLVTENALPATPTITASGPTTFCAGDSVTLTSSPGTTYLWSTGETSSSIIISTTGSYTVRVTDANGCQSASSVATIVMVNALPATPIITAGGPTTFCQGGSVTLTSSPGTTYLWSTSETSSGIIASTTGSYTVQVTDLNGCQSTMSLPVFVTENALPATPTITASGPTTFCEGGSVTLSSSPETTYLWSTGETSSGINVSTTGSYTVRVTNANGCQSAASIALLVTENALPATPTIIASGPTTFCDGGNVTLTSSAETSYLWSTGETTAGINVTAAGSYSVHVINSSGCQSAQSVPTIVTVNALPAAPVISADGPTTFCAGDSVTLTSNPASSYLWSSGETNHEITVKSSGSYSVTIKDPNGCQSGQSIPTIVAVNTLPPTPTITSSGPTTFCDGNSVTLTSSVGSTYLWSTGATTSSINIIASGNYNVITTNSSGCQSLPSSATKVTVNSNPATPTITAAGPTTFCEGGSVSLISSPGSSYLWSTGETTGSIIVTISGSYSVQVTSADGCQSAQSVPVIITVNSLPLTPAISANGPTTFCEGGVVTLTSSPGSDYIWSTGSSTATIDVTTSGSFTVQVTNINGCQSALSIPALVTVNPLPAIPTISANGPTTFCEGGSVTLTSSSGMSYFWSTGETTASIDIITEGTYEVQVTDANGCQSEASANTEVIVNSLPEALAGNNGPVCEGSSLSLTGAPSGMATYSWTGPGGFNSLLQNPLVSVNGTSDMAGVYTLKVVDAIGCTNTATTAVQVNALPAVSITSSSNDMCTDDVRTLTGSPAGGIFVLSGGPGSVNGNILTATAPGNIIIEYDYTNVCPNKATQVIIVNDTPVATAGPDQDLTFTSETRMEAMVSSSETGEWSLVSGTGHLEDIHSPTTTVTDLSIGENIFLWKVSNGFCENSAEVKITIHELIVPSVITPDGDGKNDYFKINGISQKMELIIFDRWGNEEFLNRNYLNDWDGRNNNGKELPADTYFFILKFKNGQVIKGSVLIKR